MMNRTYDVSVPGQHWCSQEVAGEYYYSKHLLDLRSAYKAGGEEEVFFTAELIPEPDNPYSENGQAISVRWKNRVIGYLPEEDSARYQQLRRIVASGYTPIAHARLWSYEDYAGNWSFNVRLSLRDPDMIAPLNEPPHDGWTLLPHGSTVQVTKESDHFDVLLDYVPPSGVGQLLVSLHLFIAGIRAKYEAVEVRLDGERIGELSKQTSGKYALAVRHFDDIGLTTFSRATIKGSSLSAEVTLQSAKAHELSEEDLEPEIAPLPRLVPFCADPAEYGVPDAYVGENAQLPQKEWEPDWEEEDWDDDWEEEEDEIEPVEEERAPAPKVSRPSAASKPTPPQSPPISTPTGEKTRPEIKVSDFYVDGKVSGAAVLSAAQKVPNKTGILLWVGIAFAVMCAIAGLGSFGESAALAIGYIMVGAGIALACGWPLRCRSQDKKSHAKWQQEQTTNRDLAQYLTDEDRTLLSGLNDSQPPAPVARKWKVVAPIAAVLIVIGFGMSSSSLPETDSPATSGVGTSP
ncbi:HIRAN domain-containing protein [Corynebacterium sp. AOP12-C2-36]|uniref:HIRAN domain-containing protein n=1 Tax=Corynebacterium sp. AOP12-C2-36 TaxID=3457723 RepID=UPI00403415DE